MQEQASLPQHVAIIMDGNGRWAKQRNKPRAAGHKAGTQVAKQIVEAAGHAGVKTLTLFAFSSENWQRPKVEVKGLMGLFMRALDQQVKQLDRNNVRLQFIGNRDRLSQALCDKMSQAEAQTRDNSGLDLIVALNYGGRWDVVQAAKKLAQQCEIGALSAAQIAPQDFAQYLSLAAYPAPDLFIRTGGEKRISNFLLWDLAYSELYFTSTLWPDFTPALFQQALASFSDRERRFGRIT